MAAVRARELCRSYYRRTGVGCMREGSALFHLKNAVFTRAETWENSSSKGAGACLMTLLMLSCLCIISGEGMRDQMRDQMRMTMRQVMSGQNLQLANNGPDAAWDETFVPLFDEKWELDSVVPKSELDSAWLPTWNAVWPHVWEAMYPKAQHGTCSYDNPCTDESFCNFDYGESGFCKKCHVCQMEGQRFITSCSQCGLPNNGTQACARTCRDNTLRLADCRADGCCRIEIEHNGIMGTVCGDGWNMRAQNVHIVCRELGCMENGGTHVQNFGGGTGKIWMDEVRCTGTESSLVECSFNPWGSVDCGHSEDVGVCCQGCPPGVVNLPSSHSPGRRQFQQTADGTCPEGYSPSDGICEACVPGTFKSIDGSASCAPCATGNCETGFFRTLCNSTNEGICQRCSNAPEGAIYTGGPGPKFEPQKCNWTCDRKSGYVSLAKNNTVCTVHERKRICYTHETACVKCETNCSTGFLPKDCTCQPCSPEFWRPVHSEYSTWTNVPDASCGWACTLGMSKISRTGKSLCRLPCPSGTYGDANEKCQVCPAGNSSLQQLSGNITVGECVECTPGKYKPMLSMLDCQTRLTSSLSVGTTCTSACVVLDEELSVCCRAFENFTTDTCHDLGCLQCPANTYSDTSGSTSCNQCPPGAASPIGSNKSTDCKCTRGYELHSSNCEKCPAGKYKSSEGGSCKACEPGTFSPNTAATVCLTCSSGFVSLNGSVECIGPADQVDVQICMSVTLDADNFTGMQMQYAVKLADAVKVSPTSVLTNQTLVKFYTSNTTVLWNIRIPRYYVAALTNLVYTTLVSRLGKIGPPPIICSRGVKEYCGFGKEVDGASCVPCMKGKYKSAGDNSSCVACKYGTTTPDLGSISESNCGCAAGYFLNISMVCDPCPVGTYKSDFSGECISCPEGKYSPGTIMSWPSKLCFFCPVDRYRSDKGSQSKKDCYCDVGQYSTGDFAAGTLTCLQCPTNADSPLNSSALKNCTCNKGSSGPDGGPCTQCVSGKYKVIEGSAMCIDCKAGTYSTTLGDWLESKCLKCGKGKYSGVVGASNETTCTACTPNSTSPAQSSAQAACTCNTGYGGDASTGTCTACVAGKYKSAMNGNCTDCGAGTYSTTVGAPASSTCNTCPSNSNSPTGSAAETSCTCNAGSSGPDGGLCTACVAGKYKASTGAAACTDCGAGTYSPATGAALCTSCGAGTYSTAEGASDSSTCSACPSNSNSPAGSAASTNCTCNSGWTGPDGFDCTPCVAGKYKVSTESALCADCGAGTYSTATGAALCTSCGAGTYSIAVGASASSTCSACPSNSSSPAGSASCSICNSGWTGPDGNICTPCVEGKYKASTGAAACTDCGAGTYSPATGAAQCTSCGAGTYSTAEGASDSSTCSACPSNSNSPAGSAAETNCTCNSGWTGPDGVVCIACVAGKYKASTGCFLNSSTCTRFLALFASRPSFSSLSTLDRAPTPGSAFLPVYNALGGPQGQGHITFDRTKLQYLDAGPRSLKIATNGGLTIVAVVRFTGTAGGFERIIDLWSGTSINEGYLARSSTTSAVQLTLRNAGTTVGSISSQELIVQNTTWLTIVATYSASTRKFSLTANNVVFHGIASESVTDKTLSGIYMGKATTVGREFNGDIAGVFVVDEYLSTNTTSGIADAMVRGVNLTSTSGASVPTGLAACTDCVAGTYSTAAGVTECTDCGTGKYSAAVGASAISTCIACPSNSSSPAGSTALASCT